MQHILYIKVIFIFLSIFFYTIQKSFQSGTDTEGLTRVKAMVVKAKSFRLFASGECRHSREIAIVVARAV